MIILNPPWWDEDGTEYSCTLINKHSLDTTGLQWEETFYDSMEEVYGEWLRENKIEFRFTISAAPVYTDKPMYNDYTLKPAIRFENDDEAMAFRLRWL